jgi:SAM-dependent methyltransferase
MVDRNSRKRFLKRILRFRPSHIPIRIQFLKRRNKRSRSRHDNVGQILPLNLPPNAHVLDIGSGQDPLPQATLLVDRFLDESVHRTQAFLSLGKPVVVADIMNLPFQAKHFDFVNCTHLLEHVDDPIRACQELMRVGKRGYIETPTFGKDSLFGWAGLVHHRWYLVGIGNTLCFFEYTNRQLEGVRSSAWADIIMKNRWHHPLQDAFYNNHDIFNVMFPWEDQFSVFVFSLDGSFKSNHPDLPM